METNVFTIEQMEERQDAVVSSKASLITVYK